MKPRSEVVESNREYLIGHTLLPSLSVQESDVFIPESEVVKFSEITAYRVFYLDISRSQTDAFAKRCLSLPKHTLEVGIPAHRFGTHDLV